ncbi:hypothetical protein T08_12736 [Trichinella sp. T8]|nr:hypothetical protein T08_12736 [Trichinella sp. T8]
MVKTYMMMMMMMMTLRECPICRRMHKHAQATGWLYTIVCTKANVYVWHLISWWYGEEQHRWPSPFLKAQQTTINNLLSNGKYGNRSPLPNY